MRRDLYQEILIAIWRALPRYRGEAAVKTYIARIAHNRCVSHVARMASLPREAALDPGLTDTAPSPLDHTSQAQSQARLLSAIRSLPLGLRQPVILTLEGFGPKEIAGIMGLSANSVSIRLTRAKSTLRKILGD